MSINKLKNRNDIIILNGILREYRDCKNNFFDLAIFPLIKKESINGNFFIQSEEPIIISKILKENINDSYKYDILLYHNSEEIVPVKEIKYRGYKRFVKGYLKVITNSASQSTIIFDNEDGYKSISDELNGFKDSYVHLEFHKQ